MEDISVAKLVFMKKLAFEFRLSLKNICKLLMIEPTNDNQKNIYDSFIFSKVISGHEELSEFNYLIYETSTEDEKSEKLSFDMARFAIYKIKKAQNSNNLGELKVALDSLRKIDKNFNDLTIKKIWRNITQEEILIITKYRIKHALSHSDINHLISISTDTLSRHEKNIESEYWRSKVKALNEYNFDLCQIGSKKNIKRKGK